MSDQLRTSASLISHLLEDIEDNYDNHFSEEVYCTLGQTFGGDSKLQVKTPSKRGVNTHQRSRKVDLNWMRGIIGVFSAEIIVRPAKTPTRGN